MSFLEYRYPLLQSALEWPAFGCRVASMPDLACMIWALGRSGLDRRGMVDSYQQKFATEDIGHVVMSLTYFDDTEDEEMPEMIWDVRWEDVTRTIEGWVRELAG